MKKDYDKALYRLTKILEMLLNDERPKIKELALEFNVTERTMQRDIYERLQAFNIEKNDQQELFFAYELDMKKSFLRVEEMYFMSLSLSQVEDIDKEHQALSRGIFRKLLKKEIYNPYFIKPEKFQPIDEEKSLIEELEKAILNKSTIEILFNHQSLKLFPYKIASFEGIWYLLADDIKEDKLKNYMISRIENIKAIEEKFTPMDNVEQVLEDVESAWYVEGNTFEVKVKIYPEIAEYFTLKKHLESQKIIETYADGSLLVSFDISHDEDVDNIIKSWLPHIEVIRPQRFRDKMITELETYLRKIKVTPPVGV